MNHDEELETLYRIRQDTITKIAQVTDMQSDLGILRTLQVLKNDVLLTAIDTCTALIIDLVNVLIAAENRINALKMYHVKEGVK